VKSSPFSGPVRAILGLLGLGSFGLGAWAVFVTDNGGGAAVLVGFGGLLVVLAVLGGRIEEIEFGGAKVRLRAEAAGRLAEADVAEEQGDTQKAARLRAEAGSLLESAGTIAANYAAVRQAQPAGRERTMAMEAVVEDARRLAKEGDVPREEVVAWLTGGTPEQRITAVGMMQAKAELRDFTAVRTAIQDPASPFEQYQSLVVARSMVPDLTPGELQALAATVKGARDWKFNRDENRRRLGEWILADIDRRLETAAPPQRAA